MIAATSLQSFFHDVYRPCRLPGSCLGTIKQHQIAMRHFETFLGREPTLLDLDDDTAAGLLAWLIATKEQAPVTANKVLEKICAQWKLANRRGLVSTWPEVRRLREPKRQPRAWSLGQLSTLLDSCRQERGQICGIPADRWWYALVVVMYYTGLRIGAMLRLRCDSVDLEAGTLVAEAETQKQLAEQRFKLPPEAIDALRAIWSPKREFVFPWPKSITLLWRDFKAILERASLPSDRRSKFHRIRKTSASYLKKAGGNPTEHMGHSSAAVTEAYIDDDIAGSRSQCHLLPPPGGAS